MPPPALFVKHVTLAADMAAAAGVTILLEPLNPRDAPGYFYASIERAEEIIAAVGRPNVKIMFDCYHVAVMQGDVLKRLERFMPRIGHVQIAAVPSRAEPDEGEIAYPAVFAALDALGLRRLGRLRVQTPGRYRRGACLGKAARRQPVTPYPAAHPIPASIRWSSCTSSRATSSRR